MKKCLKYIRRGMALVLIGGILGTGIWNGSTGEVLATGNSAELDKLEEQKQQTLQEIDELKSSISDVENEIQDLKTESNSLQNSIRELDKKSSKISNEISDFEKKIEEKEADIETTKEELEAARLACDDQYDKMKMRIQVIYERSSMSLFELLLTSDSLAEALNRADAVFRMSDYEKKMMDRLTQTKEEIALKEATLQTEHEELELMKTALEEQKKQVTASIDSKQSELKDKKAELSDANSEQSDYQKQLEEQERLLEEIEDQIAKAAQPDVYEGSSTGFIWPCPAYTRISSYFGPRPQPVPGASTYHKGIDLAAPYGANILASAAGKVTTSKYSVSAGNYIVIAHGNGISTVYMHCSSLLVSVGETVSQGQVIAKVGSTGYSSGNHLHFGVIKNGTYVDPLGYISP